jgi:hypothetical protein
LGRHQHMALLYGGWWHRREMFFTMSSGLTDWSNTTIGNVVANRMLCSQTTCL